MKVIFENEDLEYIFEHGKERGKPKFSAQIVRGFIKKLNIILELKNTVELRKFKGLRFEALSGDYSGFHSIRINDQYRIIIQVAHEKDGSFTTEVIHIHEVTDYH